MRTEEIEHALAALRLAQQDTCSLHCPSVKKTGEEWIHVERCQAVSAAIAAVESALTTPAKAMS
jgi:hypothetical protein